MLILLVLSAVGIAHGLCVVIVWTVPDGIAMLRVGIVGQKETRRCLIARAFADRKVFAADRRYALKPLPTLNLQIPPLLLEVQGHQRRASVGLQRSVDGLVGSGLHVVAHLPPQRQRHLAL